MPLHAIVHWSSSMAHVLYIQAGKWPDFPYLSNHKINCVPVFKLGKKIDHLTNWIQMKSLDTVETALRNWYSSIRVFPQ